jgi:hypothetical protein
MKNKVLYYMVFGIFTLTLASCGNRTETQTKQEAESETTMKTNLTETQSDFIYSSGDKKLEMILENNAKFLVVGEPTRATFETKNIDEQRLMIIGPGIMASRVENDGFRFTIKPIEETLVDGKLKIHVSEYLENDETFTHTFSVPVKTKAE